MQFENNYLCVGFPSYSFFDYFCIIKVSQVFNLLNSRQVDEQTS